MEEAFLSALLSSGALTILCGTRINWNVRPQGEGLPAVVLTVISSLEGDHMTARDGLFSTRIQIDCWGGTAGQARDAANAARVAADFTGTVSGVRFQRVFIEEARDFFDGVGAEKIHRRSFDVIAWHD